jgi:hypothetical protein
MPLLTELEFLFGWGYKYFAPTALPATSSMPLPATPTGLSTANHTKYPNKTNPPFAYLAYFEVKGYLGGFALRPKVSVLARPQPDLLPRGEGTAFERFYFSGAVQPTPSRVFSKTRGTWKPRSSETKFAAETTGGVPFSCISWLKIFAALRLCAFALKMTSEHARTGRARSPLRAADDPALANNESLTPFAAGKGLPALPFCVFRG